MERRPAADRSWRRRLVTVSLLVVVGSLVSAPGVSADSGPINGPILIPPKGSLFGIAASQSSAAVTSLEATLGRPLDTQRVYSNMSTAEPIAQVRWDVTQGITPVLSIASMTNTGTPIPWAQIAQGAYDPTIIRQAQGLSSLGAPVLLAFNHEPELSTGTGTASDFVSAWRHFVSIFRAQGVTNVSFVVILTTKSYNSSSLSPYYPGDAYVDWVGADGYNTNGCLGQKPLWRDFASIFSGLNSFAVAHANHHALAQLLLDRGADPHEGVSLLHSSCDFHFEFLTDGLTWLSSHGVDPNRADEHGQTGLHKAAACGYLKAARCLIALGADPDRKDARGLRPTDVARLNRRRWL